MGSYKIAFVSSALKELKKLPRQKIPRVMKEIEALGANPRPHGCKKLSGEEYWRIRIGSYRVVYSIESKTLTVLIIRIGHRKDVYK